MNLFFRLLRVILRAKRGTLRLDGQAATPFRVVPTDLDVLGHMNNGKYLSLMDLGRMDLMLRSGFWSQVRERGWYPVAAGVSITYRKPLTLGQRFDIETKLLGNSGQWAYVQQTFRAGDVVHAHAVVRARFLKQGGGAVQAEELVELSGLENLTPPAWVDEWTEVTKHPVHHEVNPA